MSKLSVFRRGIAVAETYWTYFDRCSSIWGNSCLAGPAALMSSLDLELPVKRLMTGAASQLRMKKRLEDLKCAI